MTEIKPTLTLTALQLADMFNTVALSGITEDYPVLVKLRDALLDKAFPPKYKPTRGEVVAVSQASDPTHVYYRTFRNMAKDPQRYLCFEDGKPDTYEAGEYDCFDICRPLAGAELITVTHAMSEEPTSTTAQGDLSLPSTETFEKWWAELPMNFPSATEQDALREAYDNYVAMLERVAPPTFEEWVAEQTADTVKPKMTYFDRGLAREDYDAHVATLTIAVLPTFQQWWNNLPMSTKVQYAATPDPTPPSDE